MQQPALSSQRIITVDALRGIALLGILFAHFIYWYSGAALPNAVYEKYADTGSIIVSIFNNIFIFGKFFTFFSFLFGLSFYLQMQSLQKKEKSFVFRYFWRLVLLGVIGLVHHALWRGDILSIYVPLGFILLLVRKINNRFLIIVSVLLILNVPARLIDAVTFFSTKSTSGITPPVSNEEAQRYYDVIKTGSFSDLIKDNWKALLSKFSFQFQSGRIYITLGFFMLGMYAGRKRWFENPVEAKPIIKSICRYSGWISLGIILFSIGLFAINTAFKIGLDANPYIQFLFSFLYDSVNSGLTVFYLTGLTLLMYKIRWQKILFPLASVGKMAITVYLSQTFFGLLLFYNIGFGLFEKTAPWFNILLAILVFIIQVFMCRFWLKYFIYGPVEWLWRSLTFFKWYPMKKGQLNKI